MAGVVTVSARPWRALFAGLSPGCSWALPTALRQEGVAEVRKA
ncbi:hypothetical protein ACIRU3_42740 [Streptomyces sp. NPDC101151]